MASGEEDQRGPWYDPEQNFDEQTQKQQREIESLITNEQPQFVAELSDLVDLEQDFTDHPEFSERIQELKDKYANFRRIKADGNCFYRAFGYAAFEQAKSNPTIAERLRTAASETTNFLIEKCSYEKFTVEDFYDNFIEQLDLLIKEDTHITQLDIMFNDQGMSDYLVVFFRLMTAAHLRREEEFFMNFIDEARSVLEFIAQEVEPMGRESDHLQIMALTQCTNINIQLFCMERNQASVINFPSETKPDLHLLFRPGHYEIIYTRS